MSLKKYLIEKAEKVGEFIGGFRTRGHIKQLRNYLEDTVTRMERTKSKLLKRAYQGRLSDYDKRAWMLTRTLPITKEELRVVRNARPVPCTFGLVYHFSDYLHAESGI